MKKIFTLVRIVCLTLLTCLLLTSCGKRMLVYHVNKSSGLQEYESELAEESLAEESIAEASREAEEAKAAEQKKAEEGSFVKKVISREKTKVKGIYLTDSTAGSDRMEDIISHIDETELNAVVIDVKNDEGKLALALDSEKLQTLGASAGTIKDLPGLVSELHSHGIYAIARIVCFRDPHMAEIRPDLMEQKADGSLFYDHSGMCWVNPYKQEYWEYLDAAAEGCALAGFDEVQLDYVRFCTEKACSPWCMRMRTAEKRRSSRNSYSLCRTEWLNTAYSCPRMFSAPSSIPTRMRRLSDRIMGKCRRRPTTCVL